MRVLRHLLCTRWALTRRFDAAALVAIEKAVSESESTHRAEIRFAVEAALDLGALRRCRNARRRAAEVFADLGVWDTLEKNGVLIYVLLAEHAVEIVADRGFDGRVAPAEWRQACEAMDAAFARGEWQSGALSGIAEVTQLAARVFPASGITRDELPNRPVVI